MKGALGARVRYRDQERANVVVIRESAPTQGFSHVEMTEHRVWQ